MDRTVREKKKKKKKKGRKEERLKLNILFGGSLGERQAEKAAQEQTRTKEGISTGSKHKESSLSLYIYTYTARVYQKSLNGFARLYLRNPWDYRNGIGAKRCVLSLSFV
jgi:hypothetical protein